MPAIAILDQVTITADGTVELKWLKIETDTDGNELWRQPHRTSVNPTQSLEATIDAIGVHLSQEGFKTDKVRDKALALPVRDIGPLVTNSVGKRMKLDRVTLCADGSIGVRLARQRLRADGSATGETIPEPHIPINFDADLEVEGKKIADVLATDDAKSLHKALKVLNSLGKSDARIMAIHAAKLAGKQAN